MISPPEDRLLPHQIRLVALSARHPLVRARLPYGPFSMMIAVTCRCLTGPPRRPGRIIEMRTLFPAADAIAAWQEWHEEQGVML